MKILLIRPPSTFFQGSVRPLISLPIGLLSIAALLEQEAFSVEIYDAQVNISRPIHAVADTMVMGDSWEVVADRIKDAQPDIIGISCAFSVQRDNALRTAALARTCHPKALIIAGGPHASVLPHDLLGEDSAVDLVCTGEGEYTMLEVARVAQHGGDTTVIPGTVVRLAGAVQANATRPPIADLDALPFPAYHLVAMEHYFRLFSFGFADRPLPFLADSHRAVSVVTSRGCPFNCVFCSIHLHMGKRWRGNSAAYVARHLDLLVQQYNVKHVHFEDDNISFSQQRFVDIVSGLPPLGITWDTPNGVRVDTLTKDIVGQCRDSGCTYLVFGVESGNQRVLDSIVDKRLDLAVVRQAARWCKDARLDSMAFYVIGFPGETPRDMKDTVDFALELYASLGVKPNLFLATPLPGTRLESLLLEQKLIEKPLGSEQLAAMTQGSFRIDGGTFTGAEVDALRRDFLLRYRKVFVGGALRFLVTRPAAVVRLFLVACRVNSSLTLLERLFSALQLKYATLESPK